MHLFRRALFKSTNLSDNDAFIPRLPVELWEHIFGFLGTILDLFVLSHVSRAFRVLVLPFFKTLELPQYIPGAEDDYRILKMFRDSHRASIVTSLIITLPYVSTRPAMRQLDVALGEALRYMINLDNLEVNCRLCGKDGHHLYLTKLGARRLRHLSIQCFHNENPTLDFKRERIFATFRSVETLKWWSPLTSPAFSPTLGLTDPASFPNLNALEYNIEDISKILLATRPIRRLQVANVHPEDPLQIRPQLLSALNRSPGRLTHLIFSEFEKFKAIIESEPLLFVQLQHIGSIPLFLQRDVFTFIDANLSVLKLLPNLTSLDAMGGEWTHAGLIYLIKRSYKLRKVLVHTHGPSCFVWKRQGETWERRDVSRFTPWDVIRGHCDQL
ncbi:hypothetical protein M408DRAFT_329679 [Serendipita vermifera MAFF 305830]|uniref:F-box domain-containing protein n=1 Tax=Serendipita vermifera MAFF 305830 TaxID=933852 RepID=A0A0C3B784_SERVB|nr:hypothetical protein M408DRAFT_329679 [Serendipita vermifera MAFF 305830]